MTPFTFFASWPAFCFCLSRWTFLFQHHSAVMHHHFDAAAVHVGAAGQFEANLVVDLVVFRITLGDKQSCAEEPTRKKFSHCI